MYLETNLFHYKDHGIGIIFENINTGLFQKFEFVPYPREMIFIDADREIYVLLIWGYKGYLIKVGFQVALYFDALRALCFGDISALTETQLKSIRIGEGLCSRPRPTSQKIEEWFNCFTKIKNHFDVVDLNVCSLYTFDIRRSANDFMDFIKSSKIVSENVGLWDLCHYNSSLYLFRGHQWVQELYFEGCSGRLKLNNKDALDWFEYAGDEKHYLEFKNKRSESHRSENPSGLF